MGKTIVAGGTVFGLEGVEDFYSRPITISKINSVGYDYISVSIHLDIGVEVEDARVLVDAIGPFTCYRMSALADNGVVDQRHICEDTINVFNELVGIGVPSDMALAAALTVDLDTSITPGFASQLKNLGAVLQVDNNTFESSFEIFIRGANYVGVEQMFRMFRIFGSSIINQRKAFEIASKITKKSLSSFSLVDDDSLMAVCNFLSVCETEVAAELIVEIINDVDPSKWPFIAEVSNSIDQDNFDRAAELLNVNAEDLKKSFNDYNGRVLIRPYFAGKSVDIYALLVVVYGFQVFQFVVENILYQDYGQSAFISDAHYAAVVSYIGKYEDYDTPVHLIVDIAGLPDIDSVH